ncbi:MAG: tail fiber domain-containing protein, partial [Bacteroidota bacterium]
RPQSDNTYDVGTPTRRWDNVWATNGIIQTSDRRLKTQILPLSYGLMTIMQMRPVSFVWKDTPAQQKVGLIAQEVQEVVPEVVVGDPNEEVPLGLNYAELVPVLIQAIQDQQAQIETYEQAQFSQQQEIDELKKELLTLKALIHEKR